MSRIGKKPIPVPGGVTVRAEGGRVSVKGPRGELELVLRPEVAVEVDEARQAVVVTRTAETKFAHAMHGTTRALVANMVRGVSEGFEKVLEIWGIGYSAQVSGDELSMQIGFCHAVTFAIPPDLEVTADRASSEGQTITRITVRGADRQRVGQFAAEVRRVRPPEPYKGKGIRYRGERILRKVGKVSGGATA